MTVQPNISAAERQAGAQSGLSLHLNLRCGGANRRFQFHKCRQLFIRSHDETASIAAMCVRNPDRSPFAIYRRNTAPRPSCFTQIVGDYFPLLHSLQRALGGSIQRLGLSSLKEFNDCEAGITRGLSRRRCSPFSTAHFNNRLSAPLRARSRCQRTSTHTLYFVHAKDIIRRLNDVWDAGSHRNDSRLWCGPAT
jgi:hypothetical protein